MNTQPPTIRHYMALTKEDTTMQVTKEMLEMEEMNPRDIDLSAVHAVCNDCARTLGFTPKDKKVGVWMDKCGICYQRKPCTDLWHDWNPPKRGGGMKNESTARPKVLVIDDTYFIFSAISKTLDFCEVEHVYGIPEDESELADFDVLIVDGEGIGNSKYKDGIEFCKAYEKQGNNKGLIYHSGLEPYGEDEQILTKLGVNIVVKGRDPDWLVEAVKEALVV